ncbi:MAG: TRZ/ATZ family hydrolase [Pseudomonadota bacterium]
MTSVTFCLHPRWIIPVEPAETVLENTALVVKEGAIHELLPSDEARQKYAMFEHITLPTHVLFPGFVNTHGHSAMALLRGIADDLALMEWLNEHIWPAEKKHVSDDFVFDGSLLAMSEMLRGGTTTINDMYFHHEAVARAGLAAHMRTVVGCSILEFPTPYAANAQEYISKAIHAHEQFKGEALIRFTLAPHAPYTVSDETFQRVTQLAEELDCGIHCHLHETLHEVEESVQQYGVRPLERLQKLGFLSERLIAAHGVHLNEHEIEVLARHRVSVAHNPTSNLKLASGIAPITALRAMNVNVGIGTDSAASNNKLDMLAEARLSALLAKVQANQPKAIPAMEALEMATLGGAKALKLDHLIGSLKAGKRADLVAIDFSELTTQPCFDPISQLIYAADRSQITHVWVDGKAVVDQKNVISIDQHEVRAKTAWWHQKIIAN